MANHPDPQDQPVRGPDDLERNPGIGQSAGLNRREGLDEIEGDSTVEGDVENNAGPGGAQLVDHHLGAGLIGRLDEGGDLGAQVDVLGGDRRRDGEKRRGGGERTEQHGTPLKIGRHG